MGYNELEIELKKTLAQIARWRELGYMPTIEQGIALGRLQKIYAALLDLPCCDSEEIPATVVAEDTVVEKSSSVVSSTGLTSEKKSDEPVTKPEASVGTAQGDSTAERKTTATVETVVGESQQTQEEPATVDAAASTNAISQQTAGSEQPMPRVFGIEVSPYALHEMIDTLFHGNTALFHSEVAKLNEMESLEDALVYIGETYRWIPENAATIKFIDLLETRFAE